MNVDQIQLHFNSQSLVLLNGILGLVMFGVALDLKVEDFRRVLLLPKAPVIGLIAQFILLPAFTYFLISIIRPEASIALGLILVAACPGGNVSNFITHLAGGNTALSVSMTAISTTLAMIMTPFNLAFWGRLNAQTASILRQVDLDPIQVFLTIVIILGIPLTAGMLVAHHQPRIARRLRKPLKILSIGIFIAFVAIAFAMNFDNFKMYVARVFFVVFFQNALALSIGYGTSRLLRLSRKDARAVGIEVGIQNSALGLALVFTFFAGLGGMALTAAWWGIWHLVSGLSLAFYWSKRPL